LETLSQYLGNILNQIGQKYRINFNLVLSRIENGETGQISIDLLERLAKLYEISAEQLLGWDDNVTIGTVNNNQGVVVNHGTTHLHPPVDERIKELEAKVELLLGLLKKEG
jgi:transcriptional regulator with XRE-family HTH domain